jgi:hypothetical protein
VSARVRYLLLTAARTRAPMIPLAVSLFALIGTSAYRRNELGATWGFTALACCALAAWLVGAILAGEPLAQAEMATAALGGRRERTGLDALLVVLVTAALTAAFLAYPVLLDAALGGAPLLEPAPRAPDVVAAAAGHLCCGVLGGAIAVLSAPPRVARRATAAAGLALACLSCAALAGAAVLGAGWWARRSG